MTNPDPIEQQLRTIIHNTMGKRGYYSRPLENDLADALETLFDTYVARRAGLDDSDSHSETAPALRNQVDTSILESIKTAARNRKIAMPDPRMYGTDWRDVTITLHNIYDIPLWREWVTDLTTDSPDTNNQATQSRKGSL